MTNNDFLRRFRYALDLPDHIIIQSFKESGVNLNRENIRAFLKKEEEDGFVKLNNKNLGLFLDGFIIVKRGRQKPKPGQKPRKPVTLSNKNINNEILKKIKIALSLHTDTILEIFKCADVNISKAELGSLFQNPNHKNYKECLDSFLRNFLKGLTVYNRKS